MVAFKHRCRLRFGEHVPALRLKFLDSLAITTLVALADIASRIHVIQKLPELVDLFIGPLRRHHFSTDPSHEPTLVPRKGRVRQKDITSRTRNLADLLTLKTRLRDERPHVQQLAGLTQNRNERRPGRGVHVDRDFPDLLLTASIQEPKLRTGRKLQVHQVKDELDIRVFVRPVGQGFTKRLLFFRDLPDDIQQP